MGLCLSSESRAAQDQNAAIDKTLKKDEVALKQEVKILLLGTFMGFLGGARTLFWCQQYAYVAASCLSSVCDVTAFQLLGTFPLPRFFLLNNNTAKRHAAGFLAIAYQHLCVALFCGG